MILIKKAYSDFLHNINVGLRAYVIELSEFGYKDKEADVAIAAASFPRVLLTGEEPFKQMTAVCELSKEIQKLNPYTKIVIYTDGTIRPTNMNAIKNAEYVIFGKLKDTGIPYEERINENAWKWLGKAGGKFVFKVTSEKDYDEINMIIAALLINKSQVYVDINNNKYNELAFSACNHGFNLFISYDGAWFDGQKEE